MAATRGPFLSSSLHSSEQRKAPKRETDLVVTSYKSRTRRKGCATPPKRRRGSETEDFTGGQKENGRQAMEGGTAKGKVTCRPFQTRLKDQPFSPAPSPEATKGPKSFNISALCSTLRPSQSPPREINDSKRLANQPLE